METKFNVPLLSLIISSLLTAGSVSAAQSDVENSSPSKNAKSENHKQKTNKKIAKIQTPVYIPPFRGAPSNRVGGGTRSTNEELFVQTISPRHTGLTINTQPTLYFYQTIIKNTPLEFIMIASDSENPLIKTEFLSTGEKLQSIDLSQHNISLKPEVEYQWYVTIIIDPKKRAKDIVTHGAIKYVLANKQLQDSLANVEPNRFAKVLAKAGVWYDAVAETQKKPNSSFQLKSLLSQVGLSDLVIEE